MLNQFNQFEALRAESAEDNNAQITVNECFEELGHFEPQDEPQDESQDSQDSQDEPDAHLDQAFEERNEIEERGWPGDGSGTDDLADYNQNESGDYLNE
jgi:hypothetical protein